MSQWALVSASGALNPSKTATSGTATQATITSASKSMVSAVVFAGKALHEGELFCWNAELRGSQCLQRGTSPCREDCVRCCNTEITLMPIAFSRLSSLLLRTAKGRAGLVTRQVSSKNTRPGCRGMAYRKDGTSCWDPHTPSPAAGCS